MILYDLVQILNYDLIFVIHYSFSINRLILLYLLSHVFEVRSVSFIGGFYSMRFLVGSHLRVILGVR